MLSLSFMTETTGTPLTIKHRYNDSYLESEGASMDQMSLHGTQMPLTSPLPTTYVTGL